MVKRFLLIMVVKIVWEIEDKVKPVTRVTSLSWVAENVEFSLRNDKLDWSHYEERMQSMKPTKNNT